MRLAILFFLYAILVGCLQSLKPMPASAPAPERYKACQDPSECVIVDVSCIGCCQRDAVARKDSAAYAGHRERTCVGKQGAVCDCCYFPVEVACEKNLCQLKTLSQDCR
jgi:hypothetical protein